jgi:hypothetical protein
MTTKKLRSEWVDYIEGLNSMKWSINPNSAQWKNLNHHIASLLAIAQNLKSGDIEEGDTVTNGKETFKVLKLENDRAYDSENNFYHTSALRIKKKFEQ